MPKVLHINTFDRAGGAEEFALFLATVENDQLLVKRKMTTSDCVLEFNKSCIDKAFAFFDKILWKLGEKRRLKQLLSWSDKYNNTFSKISKLTAYKEADIIHLHNIHGGYFDLKSIARIAQEKNIVWTIHDRWIVTGGEAYLFDEQRYSTGSLNRSSKSLYALKSPIFDARAKHIRIKKKILKENAENIHLVAPGKHVEKVLSNGCTIGNHANISMIHYGIDCGVFRNLKNRDWTVPRVLFLNSDSPFKNTNLMLAELASLDIEMELHSYGKNLTLDISLQSNLTHIDHGYINSRAELSQLYNSVDILVFPTFHENFPLVSVEAAACGVLVLGSSIGPVVEQSKIFPLQLFSNNKTGDLSSKLVRACSSLQESRELGAAASRQILAVLDRIDTVASYRKLYTEILN